MVRPQMMSRIVSRSNAFALSLMPSGNMVYSLKSLASKIVDWCGFVSERSPDKTDAKSLSSSNNSSRYRFNPLMLTSSPEALWLYENGKGAFTSSCRTSSFTMSADSSPMILGWSVMVILVPSVPSWLDRKKWSQSYSFETKTWFTETKYTVFTRFATFDLLRLI